MAQAQKNLIAIYSQSGVFLHYLPGHEEDQVLLDGKLEILEKASPSPTRKNSNIIITWTSTNAKSASLSGYSKSSKSKQNSFSEFDEEAEADSSITVSSKQSYPETSSSTIHKNHNTNLHAGGNITGAPTNASSTQGLKNSNSPQANSSRYRNESEASKTDWTVVDDDEEFHRAQKEKETSENLISFEEEISLSNDTSLQNNSASLSAITTEPKSFNSQSQADGAGQTTTQAHSKSSTSPAPPAKKPLSYSIHLNQLKKLKRNPKNVGWSYLVLVLHDNIPLPAFHFHSGGAEAFFTILKQYTVLTEDAKNSCHFNVTLVNNEALVKSLDELNVFGYGANGAGEGSGSSAFNPRKVLNRQNVQYFLNDPVRGALDGLSKVGGLLTTVLENNPQHRPQTNQQSHQNHSQSQQLSDSNQANNIHSSGTDPFNQFNPDLIDLQYSDFDSQKQEDYELLSAPQADIERIINTSNGEIRRCKEPLTLLMLESQFLENGRFRDKNQYLKMKNYIYENGLENDSVRREVYPYLLGYRSFDATHDEYIQTKDKLQKNYKVLKTQWMTISESQELRFTEYANKKHLIHKDLIRTDRAVEEFKEVDGPSMVKLKSILMCYMMYNFDLGYCQGMSDIASVLVQIMESEVEAFHSFVGFMEIIGSNFDLNQYGMKSQMAHLKSLVQFLDPDLCSFLDKKESLNMYFCFRWLLIWFKREFIFEDVKSLWDILITGRPCRNFQLLVAAAILLKQKNEILEQDLSFTDILRFINDLSEKMDIDEIITIGSKLFDLLKGLNEGNQLPKNVCGILFEGEELEEGREAGSI